MRRIRRIGCGDRNGFSRIMRRHCAFMRHHAEKVRLAPRARRKTDLGASYRLASHQDQHSHRIRTHRLERCTRRHHCDYRAIGSDFFGRQQPRRFGRKHLLHARLRNRRSGDDARRAIDRGKAFRPHEAAFVDVYRLWHCDDGRHGRFDVRRSPHHVCHTYARRRDSNLGHSSLAHRSLCRAALRRRAHLHGFPTRRWRYTRPEFAQFGEYVGRSHYAIVFARRFDGARRHLDGDGH